MNTDEQVETMRQVLGDALAKQININYYYITTKTTHTALAVMPITEWQPIETAPKDGVFVLITDGDVVQIGYYEDHLMAWRSDAAQCRLWSDPTHWQPLPAPPERAGT